MVARTQRILLGLTLVILAGPMSASADPFSCEKEVASSENAPLLRSVEQKYQQITTLRSSFTQESLFVGLDKRESSRGQVLFQKPGKMHWIYGAPEEQRFIADGKTVWFYQPTLNQVTVDHFQASFTTDLPVTFLLGLGKLSDAFDVSKVCRSAAHVILELTPRAPDSSLQQFTLSVRSNDYAPVGARVLDLAGNETTIILSELVLNGPVAADQFTFQIPKGVDVIDQRLGTPPTKPVTEQNLLTTP